MKGTRLPGEEDRYPMAPGSYGKTPRGTWECCTPNGRLGNLASHTVVEHDDGTVTVTPSILVHPTPTVDEQGRPIELPGWHGFLTRGEWSEV